MIRSSSETEFKVHRAVWGSLPSLAFLTSPLSWLIREWVASTAGVSVTVSQGLLLAAFVGLAGAAWISSALTVIYCDFASGQPTRVRAALRLFNFGAFFLVTCIAAPLLAGLALAVRG